MNYFSLNHVSGSVNFREAAILGQAPDKGLYFPERIPEIEMDIIYNPESMSPEEMCFRVIRPYVGGEIPDAELHEIVAQTVNFPIPLVPVETRISALEMFHGNTLAFKDIGARFMSRCLGYFVKGNKQEVTVLVATSGDTGGAVADGFFGVEGIRVVILYPKGKVSNVQEKQLTTLGGNISAIEVDGTFDDCQRMVKQSFADADIRQHCFLTSANSINVARWLPQQFFYLMAWRQWKDKDHPPVIAVPSGNFGNICAGLLAMKSGLPVSHFIAACNANDVVPSFMRTHEYVPKPSVATISNAMDVGDPSNFVRILQLFGNDPVALSEKLSAVSITDEDTRKSIYSLEKHYGYLPDPHGAVGYVALKSYLENHPESAGLFAETAHPVKFFDVVEPVIGHNIPLPEAIASIMHKEKVAVSMNTDYQSLRAYLYGL